jgi:hypothetical protein
MAGSALDEKAEVGLKVLEGFCHFELKLELDSSAELFEGGEKFSGRVIAVFGVAADAVIDDLAEGFGDFGSDSVEGEGVSFSRELSRDHSIGYETEAPEVDALGTISVRMSNAALRSATEDIDTPSAQGDFAVFEEENLSRVDVVVGDSDLGGGVEGSGDLEDDTQSGGEGDGAALFHAFGKISSGDKGFDDIGAQVGDAHIKNGEDIGMVKSGEGADTIGEPGDAPGINGSSTEDPESDHLFEQAIFGDIEGFASPACADISYDESPNLVEGFGGSKGGPEEAQGEVTGDDTGRSGVAGCHGSSDEVFGKVEGEGFGFEGDGGLALAVCGGLMGQKPGYGLVGVKIDKGDGRSVIQGICVGDGVDLGSQRTVFSGEAFCSGEGRLIIGGESGDAEFPGEVDFAVAEFVAAGAGLKESEVDSVGFFEGVVVFEHTAHAKDSDGCLGARSGRSHDIAEKFESEVGSSGDNKHTANEVCEFLGTFGELADGAAKNGNGSCDSSGSKGQECSISESVILKEGMDGFVPLSESAPEIGAFAPSSGGIEKGGGGPPGIDGPGEKGGIFDFALFGVGLNEVVDFLGIEANNRRILWVKLDGLDFVGIVGEEVFLKETLFGSDGKGRFVDKYLLAGNCGNEEGCSDGARQRGFEGPSGFPGQGRGSGEEVRGCGKFASEGDVVLACGGIEVGFGFFGGLFGSLSGGIVLGGAQIDDGHIEGADGTGGPGFGPNCCGGEIDFFGGGTVAPFLGIVEVDGFIGLGHGLFQDEIRGG